MSINTGKDVRWWAKLTPDNKLYVVLLWGCIGFSGVIVHLHFKNVAGLEKQNKALEKRNEALENQNTLKDQALIRCGEEKDLMRQQSIDYLKEQIENKKEASK